MIISAEILSAFPSIGSFSLDLQKFSKTTFLYAERALGYTTKKEANHLARDFFVRQFKVLDDKINESFYQIELKLFTVHFAAWVLYNLFSERFFR